MHHQVITKNKHLTALSINPRKNQGFTLIELIIVIVILGILAVTAAPKFIDVSEDAHLAVTKGEAAAFKSAIGLVRSVYLLRNTTPIEVAGGSVAIDSVSGFPTGSGGGSASCVDLWNDILQNAEPVVAASNPNAALASGWNAFRFSNMCAYGKQFGDRTFASGDLPHFVYYIRETNAVNFNGQTYQGSAGTVQNINL
jgi:prepilin-type N-terminal cleavage/methylation domain-containing protein